MQSAGKRWKRKSNTTEKKLKSISRLSRSRSSTQLASALSSWTRSTAGTCIGKERLKYSLYQGQDLCAWQLIRAKTTRRCKLTTLTAIPPMTDQATWDGQPESSTTAESMLSAWGDRTQDPHQEKTSSWEPRSKLAESRRCSSSRTGETLQEQ